tara:strand:+ start:1357 stop:1548 length:192 start_codon:yes stop_codon:yes gene_type:complete
MLDTVLKALELAHATIDVLKEQNKSLSTELIEESDKLQRLQYNEARSSFGDIDAVNELKAKLD